MIPLIAAIVTGAVVIALLEWLVPSTAALVAYSLLSLSLTMLMGWVGQVTLGQFGFALLGGWIALAGGLPYLPAVLVAGTVGAIVSPLIGVPPVRHGGDPTPVTSMAWGLFAYTLFTSPTLLGHADLMSPAHPAPTGLFAGLVSGTIVAGCLGTVAWIGRSRFGRLLASARLDPAVAIDAGVSLPRWRLGTFVLTGFIASSGGALLAFAQGGLIPSTFATNAGARMVSWTGIGGMGSVIGVLIGTAAFGAVVAASGSIAIRFAITGAVGLAVLNVEPSGLIRWIAYRRRTVRPDGPDSDVRTPPQKVGPRLDHTVPSESIP